MTKSNKLQGSDSGGFISSPGSVLPEDFQSTANMRGHYPNQSESYLHLRNPGEFLFVLGTCHFSLPTSIFSANKSSPNSPSILTLNSSLSPVLWKIFILCWIAVVGRVLDLARHSENLGPSATMIGSGEGGWVGTRKPS